MLGGEPLEHREVKAAGTGVEPQHADEQDGRREKGVEEVAYAGAAPIGGAAEGGNEDRHGDERHLPEGVVEEEIERDEDAEDGGLLQQEQDVKELAASGDGVPAGQHAKHAEQAGEHAQPHREAVDAEMVMDGGRSDPGEVLLELEAGVGGAVVEVRG